MRRTRGGSRNGGFNNCRAASHRRLYCLRRLVLLGEAWWRSRRVAFRWRAKPSCGFLVRDAFLGGIVADLCPAGGTGCLALLDLVVAVWALHSFLLAGSGLAVCHPVDSPLACTEVYVQQKSYGLHTAYRVSSFSAILQLTRQCVSLLMRTGR